MYDRGFHASGIQEIADANINIDMIIQNASQDETADISFTVAGKDLDATLKIAERLKEDIGCRTISTDKTIAKVSAIGIGMQSHVGVAARMFNALGKAGVNIQMISTSEIKISCAIDKPNPTPDLLSPLLLSTL